MALGAWRLDISVLDISGWAIVKIVLSGLFVYVVCPFLMIIRDLIVLIAIEKLILTKRLKFDINKCERARWELNHQYKQACRVSNLTDDEVKYEVAGKSVTKEQYEQFRLTRQSYQDVFRALDLKINSKHNLISSVTKQYKTDSYSSPIPKMREEALLDIEQKCT